MAEKQAFRDHHWINVILTLFTIAFLPLSAFSFRLVASHPWIGIEWSFVSGQVVSIDPESPAQGLVSPTDVIQAIDGVPLLLSSPLFAGTSPGNVVHLTVIRNGIAHPVKVRLAKQPWPVLVQQVLPLIVACAVWVCGATVLMLGTQHEITWLFVLFCLLFSSALTLGAASYIGPRWMARLFNISLWWLGPLCIHFHLCFSRARSTTRCPRWLLGLYSLSVASSVPYLRWDLTTLRSFSWYPMLHTASRAALAAGFVGAIALMIHAYPRTKSTTYRLGVRLIALGSVLSLAPFVMLGLIPEMVLGYALVPYWGLFLLLLSIPLAYGYTILHYRLLEWDHSINRTMTHIVTLVITASGVIVLSSWTRVRLSSSLYTGVLVDLVTVLLVTYLIGPIHRQVQRLIDWVFYQGWYDPHDVIEHIIQELNQASGPSVLISIVCQELCSAMKLRCACLMLTDVVQLDTRSVHSGGTGRCDMVGARKDLSVKGALYRHFDRSKNMTSAHDLRRALADQSLTLAEQGLIDCEQISLWVPLFDRHTLLGLLAIGPQLGGNRFEEADYRALGIIASQLAKALRNHELSYRLRARIREVEALHQRLIRLREKERKRIARELHDRVIQDLVSMQFQISRAGDGSHQSTHESIHQLVDELRTLCRELRPPILDNFGLVPAVRSYVRQVDADAPFRIALDIIEHRTGELPEEIALTFYRVLQEALINIQKHAAAERVTIRLIIRSSTIELSVHDDGQGFHVPPSFGQFLAHDSFGLIGLRERLESVEGTLQITSTLGFGTELCAKAPLVASMMAPTYQQEEKT